MLHAVNDNWRIGAVVERDNSFNAQQIRAVQAAQQFEKNIKSLRGHRNIAAQAEGANVGIVAINIVVMMIMAKTFGF